MEPPEPIELLEISSLAEGERSSTAERRIVERVKIEKGRKIVEWYEAMFEKTTTFASILASVMFSAMILELDSGNIPNGTEDEVRTWAASGALLFVILVLLCTGGSLGMKYHAERIARLYTKKNRLVGFVFALGSLLFQGLLLSGTMFFCLVVKAYAPVIGWTAFGITAVCALMSLGVWAWELKGEILKQLRRKQDETVLGEGTSDIPPIPSQTRMSQGLSRWRSRAAREEMAPGVPA